MLQVEFENDAIVFNLKGVQKVWALKRRLKIPLKSMESVSTEKVKMPWLAFRVGTHLPKFFMAGTFWTKEDKIFCYVRDASKCVTLKLRDQSYDQVIIQVDDKEKIAQEIKRIKN